MAWIAAKYVMVLRKFLLLLMILSPAFSAEAQQCRQLFSEPKTEPAFKESFKTNNSEIANKDRYFKEISWVLKNSKPEIRNMLSKVNNELGTDIEIKQVVSFLNGVSANELALLNNIETIENAVVYGSTNVPLYTLITQIFLVGSFSKNVWVRTPEATRDLYVQLFNFFKMYLPKEITDRIHLVTDPSDLSYDVFNRIFVMGQNRNGNKVLRPPAELVVLTGNPDTARAMIERNIRNLKKIADENSGARQLFLGFLAGVNPAIVVSSAAENLKQVVNKILFPFLVNGGQDCMNSDVVLVQGNIIGQFKREVLSQVKNLSISPLTMSKNLDKLISYREKYAKYLLNPEAKIHPETKQVEPHVFVIPFSKFKELELQEHFGPFLTIVQYNDFTDIETAALDPRFQKKAMSALIFGGSRMTPELERARDLFRQNQHSVVTNSHLYEEFDMNFPFGGVGSDSSISTLAQIEKTGVRVQNRNRPLLISKEVENVFHKKDSIQQVEPSLKEWKPLGKTQITEPITIKEIQKLARDQGLAMPVSYSYENSKERIEAQKLNGIKLIEPKDQKRDFPGVLLHTVDVKNILQKQNYLGKLNPLLSDVERHRQLLTKDKELSLVRSVDPSLMPNAKTLFESMERSPEFESQRQDILARLKSFSKRTSEEEFDKLERIVHIFIHRILEDVRRSHPRGAYIKNYGEFASGDVGNTITTFQSSAAQITKEFMLWVRQGFVKFPAKGYMDQAFQGFITGGNHANSTRFVNRFLIDPDNILVQDRLDTAQTDLGLPMEFRVDFIQGQAVLSRMRFGYEYYPREIKNSMEVLNAFMKKAPEEVRHLSGGADVALTRDGHWVIFEFNFGGASGTLSPEYYPFEANEIFSLLQDKKTWLLEFGDNLLRKSLAEQKAFIQTLKNAKPIWWRISVDDISQLEWARWLRDKKLENWAKSENKKEAASKLREELSALLLDLGSYGNLDFQRLYESADHYLFREGY